MSLRPLPSPCPSPSVSSVSDNEQEFDIPDLPLAPADQAPAPWDDGSQGSGRTSLPLPLANHLPHEILIYILKFVPSHTDLHSSLLVSRQWCQCSVELLWHKPVFGKASSLWKLITIISLARPADPNSPFLLSSDDDGFEPPKRPLTFPYPRFLRRLNLVLLSSDCTDNILSRLSTCTRLERLTLTNCSALTSVALTHILPKMSNLVALDLTNVVSMDDGALQAIAKVCLRLQGINLTACVKITDEGVLALARHSKMLRRVKLCGLTEVTDRAFAELATGCPLLLEVDLNGCKGVEDDTPRGLFTHSRQLRELKLAQCDAVTDDAFPLPPLPTTAPASFLYFRSLNPGQYALPRDLTFDHLRMLDLTGCIMLSDDGLERIISNSLRIRNLVLAKCSSLSEDSVESIGKLGKHLHYLHLGHVSNLTDRSITILARSCTRLRYVDLACCPLLTDLTVLELAALPKLRRVGLVRVASLTDNALFALAERHGTLERIHLSYCENITVPAIHFLLQKLLRLTHLSLTGVPAFRRPELQKFCRTPPKEFNDTQRRTFCVYSGKGVHDLRKYLAFVASTPFPFVTGGESDSDASTTPPPDPMGGMNFVFGDLAPPSPNTAGLDQLETLSLGVDLGEGSPNPTLEEEGIDEEATGDEDADETAYGPSYGAVAGPSNGNMHRQAYHTAVQPPPYLVPPRAYRPSLVSRSGASSAATSFMPTPTSSSSAVPMRGTPDVEPGDGGDGSDGGMVASSSSATVIGRRSEDDGSGQNGQGRRRGALGFLFRRNRSRSRERDSER